MGLETGTYISDLVITNPLASDLRSQGDDHLRLIKSVLKATFPNITGVVTSTQAQLNGSFPATTTMTFFQAAAPTGWVQNTTDLDRAIRIVGGVGGGVAGSVRFQDAFSATVNVGTVGYHQLTVAELPSHTHGGVPVRPPGGDVDRGSSGFSFFSFDSTPGNTDATGANSAHNHPFTASGNLAVRYLDMILATKS